MISWAGRQGLGHNKQLILFVLQRQEAANLVTGIPMLVASVIAGAMWDLIGYRETFVAGAPFTALTVLGLLSVRHRLDGRGKG